MLIKVSRSGTFRPFHDRRQKRLLNHVHGTIGICSRSCFKITNINIFFKWILLVDEGGEDE